MEANVSGFLFLCFNNLPLLLKEIFDKEVYGLKGTVKIIKEKQSEDGFSKMLD